MLDQVSGQWSVGWSITVFVLAGAATVVCSVRLAALGDTLADRTGWGEALFGAVFFGLVTSLSGIVMTAVSAADGHPQLAYSNAVGGIAAQTLAVAVADAAYRRANLEHSAASPQNLLFGCLLLATAVAAVRRGAVTLAIAAVVGGNCLDVLNLAVGDVAYRGGSLYHAAQPDELFLTSGALVMTAVLLGGLLVRQRRGWWGLGFDGVLLITVYAITVAALAA